MSTIQTNYKLKGKIRKNSYKRYLNKAQSNYTLTLVLQAKQSFLIVCTTYSSYPIIQVTEGSNLTKYYKSILQVLFVPIEG